MYFVVTCQKKVYLAYSLMDQEILNSYSRINHLIVSRETFFDFENYISMILEKNKKINIISQNTASKKSYN